MPQFLIAIHHPDDYDPAVTEDAAMTRAIDTLNQEMIAAGVRVVALGLHPAREAKSLQARTDGSVAVSDGPYLKTAEHVGGFWIPDVTTMEDAVGWARKAVVACRAPVEVRRFF
jgi:hypothetical protein